MGILSLGTDMAGGSRGCEGPWIGHICRSGEDEGAGGDDERALFRLNRKRNAMVLMGRCSILSCSLFSICQSDRLAHTQTKSCRKAYVCIVKIKSLILSVESSKRATSRKTRE